MQIQVDESRTSLLQRSLNELEAQIGDLTKSKQSAVKGTKSLIRQIVVAFCTTSSSFLYLKWMDRWSKWKKQTPQTSL